MKKRFVALLLCLVMVVGLIPAAMAAGSEVDRNYITFKANDGSYGSSSERLQQIVNSLSAGFDGQSFAPMSEYLLVNDPFMCMADFESYRNIHEEIMHTYGDREKWNRMSLMNIAGAGKFAADRSITEYAQRIWHLSRLTK